MIIENPYVTHIKNYENLVKNNEDPYNFLMFTIKISFAPINRVVRLPLFDRYIYGKH